MNQRVLTAVVLIPVIVSAVLWGPSWLIAAFTGLVTLVALYEFFRLGSLVGLGGYPRWTVLCALWLIFEQWAAGEVSTFVLGGGVSFIRGREGFALGPEVVLVLFALGAGLLVVARRGGRGVAEIMPALGMSAAGMLLVALPLSYLVRLHALERLGRQVLLFTLVLIWAGDTLAYFIGRAMGRLPMAPVLSPKKTWEGAVANVVGSLIAAVFFARWMNLDVLPLLAVAAAANVAGQVGDLVESAYKRGAGVKDSGALLPGHGGVLDRVDSLIFAAPVVWCYFGILNH